jgi:hypothetical protein
MAVLEPGIFNTLHSYLSTCELTSRSTVGAIIPTKYLWSGTIASIGQMRRCLGSSGVGSERNSMRRPGATIGTQSWPCWYCAAKERMPSYTVKRWLMCRLPCQGLGASRGKSEAPYTALDSVDEKMRCDARAWASGALRGTFDREEEGHEGSLPQDMGTLMATLSSPASIILVLPKQHEPRPSRRPRKPPSSLRLIQHTTRGCLGPVSSRPPALSPSRCVM